ncbi:MULTISPECIES: CRISPR-associated protein Cas5 [unclassified Thermosynechococcus]|uniref:CRISPR-associated protein Cas5 n=1 Tax=unclassified Thermosynechococcus TaxID=2622553 RepID=UPI0026722C6B|nr:MULTISPECIES: CRISPR-associated protein Cas5 [unclassified Thermosynechococcus]MDR5639737.1 CRISPR-associated protein Cas5 [Thermosynechococcus sp. PP42]MDR7898820.1 CRISPR-associated protein Cas5 [Thermosynechococcus sp. JY1332]MDR7906225.1 CRISPR-associated protein Cas5 [Thermosynechococcus sp. JY1334]MDR7921596.1 CRISPR-associated protein Cas5 [Thermosynechococcus sp. HY213]MDR7994045.1 CRISPR-associated protein Cas5 [Thermosynechococcus sp. TG252]
MQLYIDCPCTSFPRSFARDFKETYRYPPPSTIYGMLLSLIGEENLDQHWGVKLAIGIVGADPPISRILRKQRHHKFSKNRLGTYSTSKFSKPNHHELLTDVQVVVKVDSSEENAPLKLVDRLAIALTTPQQISRFGGLSLGESWALVNGVRPYRDNDGSIRWLIKDNRGLISLPIWIDRQSSQGTFQRFRLGNEFEDHCWVRIPQLTVPTPRSRPSAARRS